jgi:quinolinate synthase
MNAEAQALYEEMKVHLGKIVPDVELKIKAEIAVEINQLKREKNAVILGHNYMEPVLFYSIPDFKGDSLDLSRKAAETDKDVIVFCGVRFMAETAKILNPRKTVLLPAKRAGCSLAESITAEDVRALRRKYPGVPVVTYVNTYADVKAESDICCTSGNAIAVVESLKTDTVIFLPDEYLAGNVAKETGKHIIFPSISPFPVGGRAGDEGQFSLTPTPLPLGEGNTLLDVQMIGWRGRCEVHEKFTVEDIRTIRKQFPEVVVLTHPECSPEVVAESDFSGSTNAMIRYVQETQAQQYLVLTECSMGDNIAAANPEKDMLRLCMVRCPHMNMITMEDTRDALKFNRYEITVPEEIRLRAFQAVDRMIKIG